MAKWLPIDKCGVVNATILVDNPAWDTPRIFMCHDDVHDSQRRAIQLNATVWCEIPRRVSAKAAKKSDGYTPEFEAVWAACWTRRNTSKWDAFRAWQKCTPAQQQLIAEIMPEVAREISRSEEQHRPHLTTWINGKRFETFRAAPRMNGSVHSGEGVSVDWRRVLDNWKRTENWNVMAYGPPPGHPGCRVPQRFL